jgi:hypothetical protein
MSLNPDGNVFEQCGDTNWRQVDWQWLFERAARHKIAALFAARMEQHGLTASIPMSAKDNLLKIREAAHRKAIGAVSTLQQVAEAYRRKKIPFFVVKGIVLAEHVYENRAVRLFSDMDIVVRSEDIEPAEEALLSLGYTLYCPPKFQTGHSTESAETLTRNYCRTHARHLTFGLPEGDGRLPVELHWHISDPGVLKVDQSALWQNIACLTVGDVPVQTLNLEATLIHLAVHALRPGPIDFRLLHLCDVAWLIARLGQKLDADLAWKIANAWGAQHYLICALQMVRDLIPFKSPSACDRLVDGRFFSRMCLRLAADDGFLLDNSLPENRWRRLGVVASRRFFWDLALWLLPLRQFLAEAFDRRFEMRFTQRRVAQ